MLASIILLPPKLETHAIIAAAFVLVMLFCVLPVILFDLFETRRQRKFLKEQQARRKQQQADLTLLMVQLQADAAASRLRQPPVIQEKLQLKHHMHTLNPSPRRFLPLNS